MKIAFLLHFYQPHDQQDDILDRIVNESYRPLVEGLLDDPKARVIVNITGALTQLLVEKGYKDVIEGLKTLLDRGQIEMTGSCMYHAFLPLVPESEASRQIDLNTAANSAAFGKGYSPVGFFSPEMAVSEQVFKVASEKGYKWIAVPHLSKLEGPPSSAKLYKHENHDINLFFRNKRVSSLILSSVVKDAETLVEETKDLHSSDKYWFCVMDAETFGHHRIGHEKVLFDILKDPFFEPVTASDLLLESDLEIESASLRDCTWTNSEQDFHLEGDQNSFILWKDPENPIHQLQWEFTDFVISSVESYSDKDSAKYIKARELLDVAVASDQFWWASVKPWWSLEMVEQGAHALREVVAALDSSKKDLEKSEEFYRSILDKAFEWQRTGEIRRKHLENSATHMKESFKERTPSEWYNQIILEFEDAMNKAAMKQEFETAVKWRDAVMKLQQGTDIYDVLHVVDELWSVHQIPSVKPFLEHDWGELSDFAKKHMKDVMSEEELAAWKKKKSKS